MVITPAGAEVSNAVATNWKKIWKKNLKPLADRRYYTKAQSDTKYATKVESAAGDAASNAATDTKLGSYYKKTQTDAKYAAAGSSYSKAEDDAKFQAKNQLIRGTFWAAGQSASGSTFISGEGISFGVTFSAVPTVHYMKVGDPLATGCLGTSAAPDAQPGNVCIFETQVLNMNTNRGPLALGGSLGMTAFGGPIFGQTAAAGQGYMLGSWAARPVAITNARPTPAPTTAGTGGIR